jgi:succinate dehydrogenase / fumarate reductase cytochrome b subunit
MICEFYRSTVGKKIIMAVTGLVLIGFVVGHMAGNLKMFGGMDEAGIYKMDRYAEFLRTMGADLFGRETLLWGARIVLLVCVGLHILMAFQLSAINRRARPISYKSQSYQSSTLASRGMMIGGIILLSFIVFHILHFTTGHLHFRGFEYGKVYANVWNGFQSPIIVGFYVLAMAALSFHTFHGAWSLFQTLGVDGPRLNPIIRGLAIVLSIVLFFGFVSVPLASSFHLISAPIR